MSDDSLKRVLEKINNLKSNSSADMMAMLMLIMVIGDDEKRPKIVISPDGMVFSVGDEEVYRYKVRENHPMVGMMNGLVSIMRVVSHKRGFPGPGEHTKPFDEEKGEDHGTHPDA